MSTSEMIQAKGLQNHNNFPDEANNKKRRRTFSCESCRKLKCRCDYDHRTQICHRCRTLRLVCSLNDDTNSDRPDHSAVDLKPNIEERIDRIEDHLKEIKRSVVNLARRKSYSNEVISGPKEVAGTPVEKSLARSRINEKIQPRTTSDAADEGIKISPAVVIREIGSQINGGYRRSFPDTGVDIIELGFIDKEAADELISQFIRHRRHTILVTDVTELALGKDLRHVSPFLYAVCCLHGLRYSKETPEGTPLHRKLYEHIRYLLGQILLASPLPIEEIFGILIMSLFTPSPTKGPEYIDSWILTGHCAQQAMLSISFSEITAKLKRGESSSEDQRAVRLWANICLSHLHWAAITGRPPMIPSIYLRQCNMLRDFYQMSMLDNAVVAEVLLYSLLHSRVDQKSYLPLDGKCEEIMSWKDKWNYVFDLPTSSILKISYYTVYLILARRALEESSVWRTNKEPGVTSYVDTIDIRPTEMTENSRKFQNHVVTFAVSIVQTFIGIPESLCQELPEYHYLCVAYSALVISQYDNSSVLPDLEMLNLLNALKEHCILSKNKNRSSETPTAMEFATRKALEKIHSRLHNSESPKISHPWRNHPNVGSFGESAPDTEQQISDQLASFNNETEALYCDGLRGMSSLSSVQLGAELDSFDHIEDFFGGAFLGFTGLNENSI